MSQTTSTLTNGRVCHHGWSVWAHRCERRQAMTSCMADCNDKDFPSQYIVIYIYYVYMYIYICISIIIIIYCCYIDLSLYIIYIHIIMIIDISSIYCICIYICMYIYHKYNEMVINNYDRNIMIIIAISIIITVDTMIFIIVTTQDIYDRNIIISM